MNKTEIGQMESRLHTIVTNSRYNMTNDQKDAALEDMAGYLLAMNKRLKTIEDIVSYVDGNIRLNI